MLVGIWRSAANHCLTNPRSYWGVAAKVCVFIAVARTLMDFVNTGGPQLIEFYKIYQGDEQVGKYTFRVLRDGRELEFSGGISFGAASEFKRFVDAMGALQVIHLNSVGGRISEAQRIGDLIKEKKLTTYVADRCMSACTIIFLSGRERLVTEQAKIGFHQPDFPGLTSHDRRVAIETEESRLRKLGVGSDFAHKANSATPGEMWFPSTAELLSEHVATKLVSSFDFALSGFSPTEITDEKIDSMLRGNDLYAAIQRVAPKTYNVIFEKFKSGFQRGMSVSDLRSGISPLVLEVFYGALPYTSDDNLIDFASFTVKEFSVMNKGSPEDCYFSINSEKARPAVLMAVTKRYEELSAEEQNLETKILMSFSGNAFPLPTEQDISAARDRVIGLLLKRRSIDMKLVNADSVMPSDYERYCNTFIALYEEVLKLPRKDAVQLLRYFFSQK